MGDDLGAWTGLIHNTQAGRSSLEFRRLCADHEVGSELGRGILVAAGYPLPGA